MLIEFSREREKELVNNGGRRKNRDRVFVLRVQQCEDLGVIAMVMK